jgi:uncharacterized protein YdeI (YjbR/CyaY-like superfamily)
MGQRSCGFRLQPEDGPMKKRSGSKQPDPSGVPFASADSFRSWLERNHDTTRELLVRCFKVHARDRGLSYREALDEALCFGWIDGVRRTVDQDTFVVRFTPRTAASIWSQVNIRRFGELQAQGRVRPPGLGAFSARTAERSGTYSYERRPQELNAAFERRLRGNRRAWRFYESRPPWYRRTSSHWVMSAKQPATRERRFAILLACSAEGRPIPQLER